MEVLPIFVSGCAFAVVSYASTQPGELRHECKAWEPTAGTVNKIEGKTHLNDTTEGDVGSKLCVAQSYSSFGACAFPTVDPPLYARPVI